MAAVGSVGLRQAARQVEVHWTLPRLHAAACLLLCAWSTCRAAAGRVLLVVLCSRSGGGGRCIAISQA